MIGPWKKQECLDSGFSGTYCFNYKPDIWRDRYGMLRMVWAITAIAFGTVALIGILAMLIPDGPTPHVGDTRTQVYDCRMQPGGVVFTGKVVVPTGPRRSCGWVTTEYLEVSS